ncbi:MAG: hypothetical protein IT285_15835 [Bdellovibrionales bacterium]|nr:hypothetical protein [Bdellovibrionales bacterium]
MKTFSQVRLVGGGIALVLALKGAAVSGQDPLPRVAPSPTGNPQTPAKIELGKTLYFDPRLSADGTVSCNSCHNVMGAGDDGRSFSSGLRGQRGGRSAPTVFNAAFLSVQFWDGRAPSLEEQAKGPLINPVEMGNKDHAQVIARLKQIPGYVAAFSRAFPNSEDPVTIDRLAQAIAVYERTLITPDSSFDHFLRGNRRAISAQAEAGWKRVQAVGCTSCHGGVAFAGPALPEGTGFYQRFPAYPGTEYERKYELSKDTGRMDATKNPADKGFWRVASWRNVALTAPYFHNGSVATLDEAVRVMAKTQLNKDLPEAEVAEIVAFLETLSASPARTQMPILPPNPGRAVVDVR